MSAVVSVTGGDRAKAALAALAERISKTDHVQVGFMAGSTNARTGASIPMYAAINTFGAPRANIPQRPFFQTMIAKGKTHWGADLAATMKRTHGDSAIALSALGQQMQGELQQSIIDTFAPPLSKVTLMLRKMRQKDPSLRVTGRVVGEAAARVRAGESVGGVSTKPLIDSSDMLRAATFRVVTK